MSEDAPEYKNKQDKTYEQKVEDDLGQKARTGAHLIVELQKQLKSVETEVQDAFKILDESFEKKPSGQGDL